MSPSPSSTAYSLFLEHSWVLTASPPTHLSTLQSSHSTLLSYHLFCLPNQALSHPRLQYPLFLLIATLSHLTLCMSVSSPLLAQCPNHPLSSPSLSPSPRPFPSSHSPHIYFIIYCLESYKYAHTHMCRYCKHTETYICSNHIFIFLIYLHSLCHRGWASSLFYSLMLSLTAKQPAQFGLTINITLWLSK